MKNYEVLVEVKHAAIRRLDTVSVYLGFDKTKPPVGTASFVNKPDGLYANIRIMSDINVRGLYPAIGVTDVKGDDISTGYINVLGLSEEQNVDPTIKSLL